MNSQFNYATFVELFLKPDEEHDPCVVTRPPAPDPLEPACADNPVSPPS